MMTLTAATCLALAIYHESRGETRAGQIMVAATVMERVEDSRWPDTVCGVVFQPNQFAWVNAATGGYPQPQEPAAWVNAFQMAHDALDGVLAMPETRPNHFVDLGEVVPSWVTGMKPLGKVGDHSFFLG